MLHSTFPYTQVQKDWIADLESGKYPKGKHKLQQDGKFCCLGVICEREKLPFNGVGYTLPCGIYTVNYLRDGSLLEKYGLYGGDGQSLFGQHQSLAVINDQTDTFEKVIEALCLRPEDYFSNLRVNGA